MSAEDHSHLPISGAIIEVVEYFLALNQEVQYNVKVHLKQCIQVEVDTKTPDPTKHDDFSLYSFKVTQRNLRTWFDVDGFISTWLSPSGNLFKVKFKNMHPLKQSKVPDVLHVIPLETHRKGDPGPPGSIQGFFITCPHKDNTTGHAEHHCVTRDQCGRVCTHKSSVPCIASADQEISVILQVFQTKDCVNNIMHIIYQYLHKLKILNPQFSLKLTSHISEDKRGCNFGEDLHGYKYHAGDLKLATDMGHFLRPSSIPTHALKMKPSVGSRYVIPSPPLWDDKQLALKLSVVASLIPPPPSQTDFSNEQCTELWISLFGPGNIPLHITGKTQFPVDPAQLISWQDYGLSLGDAIPPPCNSQDSQVYEADKRYQLNAIQEGGTIEESENNQKYILHLFIVLSRNDKTKPLASYERQDLLHALRSHMRDYFNQNKAKLNSATVTAINKVLKCHSPARNSSKTRTESVGQAIHSINQAISTVISHSVHDDFRQRCFSHLQVDNSVDLSKATLCKLWSISQRLHGVKVPKEFQDASASQNSQTQSQQGGSDHPRRDSTGYNLSPDRYTQIHSDDDAGAAADFANLDVFPESDEQWLESIQTGQANDGHQDDGRSQESPCEPEESEKVMKTSMGDDWFEESLLNSDWVKHEF